MPQHRRLARVRRVQRLRLASSMRWNGHCRQQLVRVRVQLLQDRGDVEAVDEQRRAARAAAVLEQMEKLQATGVGLHAFDV